MRHYFLFFGIILINFFSQAQNIERQVIASTGETISNASVTLDFTVGELAVTTITDGNSTLTQGFHQASIRLGIKINPIVFLQGALLNSSSNLMRDDLRSALLTTTSPYSDGLTCASTVFNDGGTGGTGASADNIVDWVWVELRDKDDNTAVIMSQSGLLQRDGDIVATDGLSNIEMPVKADNYYVVIKHRNHLGIMTANTVALSSTSSTVDFTDASNTITYGLNAQTTYGMPSGILAMWTGNINGDTDLKYQGGSNDTTSIKDAVLNDINNDSGSNLYQSLGYHNADVNMNGIVQYQGSGNDSNVLKDVVLSHTDNQASPSNLFIITEQLPEFAIINELNVLFNLNLISE